MGPDLRLGDALVVSMELNVSIFVFCTYFSMQDICIFLLEVAMGVNCSFRALVDNCYTEHYTGHQ